MALWKFILSCRCCLRNAVSWQCEFRGVDDYNLQIWSTVFAVEMLSENEAKGKERFTNMEIG